MSGSSAPGLARAAGSVAWTGVGSIGGAVLGVASAVIIARHLGPVQYGQYAYLTWLAESAGALASLGLARPIARFTAPLHRAGASSRARRLTAVGALIAGTSGALLGVGFVAFVGPPNASTRAVLLLCTLSSLATAMLPVLLAGLHGSMRFKPASVIALSSALLLLLGAAAVTMAGAGPLAQFAATTGASVATTSLAFGAVLAASRNLDGGTAANHEPLLPRGFISYWRASAILVLIETIVWQRSEVFFLGRYRPPADVGLYTAAFGISARLAVVPGVFSPVLYALIARLRREDEGDAARMQRIYRLATRWLALVCVPLFSTAAALSVPLLRLLFGSPFEPATPALVLLLLGGTVPALSVAGSAVMYGTDRMRFVLLWGGLAAAVTLLADSLLVPRFGITGAALGNLSGQVLAVGATTILGLRPHGFHFPTAAVARIAASGMVAALPVALAALVIRGPASILLLGVVSFFLYVLALRALGGFDASDRELFRAVRVASPIFLRAPLGLVERWVLPGSLGA